MAKNSDYKRCPYCFQSTMWIKRQSWSFPVINGIKTEECFLEAFCDACEKESKWKLLSEGEKTN